MFKEIDRENKNYLTIQNLQAYFSSKNISVDFNQLMRFWNNQSNASHLSFPQWHHAVCGDVPYVESYHRKSRAHFKGAQNHR